MPAVRELPSGRYQARYRDRQGVLRAVPGGVTYTHKKAAIKAAHDHEAKVQAGPRNADEKLTWGQWCDTWWSTRGVDDSTAARDRGRLERYVLPKWRKVLLADITRHDIRAWAGSLKDGGLSAASVARVVHLLSASLTGAVDAELIQANPAAALKLPSQQRSMEHFLTWEEWTAIADELTGPHLLMATFLVMTGARWGEAAGLHWDRVDLSRGVVTIVDAVDDLHRVIKPYPKGKRAREVPLPADVRALLPQTPAQGQTCGLPHLEGHCRSGVAIPAPRGGVWDAANFRHAFYDAVRLAGVAHTRVHDLRHTYASWLVQAGTPLTKVGALLGHASPLVTHRYAHLAPGQHDDVLSVLDGLRGTNVARGPVAPGRIDVDLLSQ